jgi:hypothetical protein
VGGGAKSTKGIGMPLFCPSPPPPAKRSFLLPLHHPNNRLANIFIFHLRLFNSVTPPPPKKKYSSVANILGGVVLAGTRRSYACGLMVT